MPFDSFLSTIKFGLFNSGLKDICPQHFVGKECVAEKTAKEEVEPCGLGPHP